MIPAAAIEAAARALADELQSEYLPEAWMDIATAALEAAAPYMLAAAWDEALKRAAEVAWEHDASASSGVSQIPNPYRPTK